MTGGPVRTVSAIRMEGIDKYFGPIAEIGRAHV